MENVERITSETFVGEVFWLDEVESTNSYLLQMVPPPDGRPLLVGTNRQTQGRGRGRNSWWAGEGALTFSLLIDPSRFGIPPQHWPLLSLTVGLAVCVVAERQLPGVDVRLKWPNDVYANGRKLCGILNESHPQASSRLVIGIGLNLNNSLVDAPVELQATGVTMSDLLGQPVDPQETLLSILNSLEHHMTALGSGTHELPGQWRSRCFLTGRSITVVDSAGEISGTCLGIDDDGALRLLGIAGEQRVYGGTIRFEGAAWSG